MYALMISFALYRLISNCIDISPKCKKKITLVLRDMMSELFIVFLVLSSTEYESNYIVFGGIFLILFLITQIKSKNKIISFAIKFFPFDIPIIVWALFQISDGNYLASFIFIAYTGWIYWYIKQTTQDNDFLLYAYAVWNAGLVSAVISLLLF
jgi:hypothetical protein